ncbi:MAG: SDR family oxidoreductase [Phycisphaerales bacterium]|nr:SDR family oxidoreductase [Phycisphaerales bacterium]
MSSSCLIFGGGGGIGSALARRLARDGWRVAVAGRSAERLRPVAEEVRGLALEADATSGEQVAGAVERAASEFGRLDAVANCVGSILIKPAHTTTEAELDLTIRQNLVTAFNVVRSAAKRMIAQSAEGDRPAGGSIVLLSSAVARHGYAAHEAIAAAKAGVIGLALSAAASYALRGVRVNVVAPGLTRTPLAAGLTASEAALKSSLALHADGKLGEPDQVASAIAWLADPEQSHVTGQVICVDGGLGSVRSK